MEVAGASDMDTANDSTVANQPREEPIGSTGQSEPAIDVPYLTFDYPSPLFTAKYAHLMLIGQIAI